MGYQVLSDQEIYDEIKKLNKQQSNLLELCLILIVVTYCISLSSILFITNAPGPWIFQLSFITLAYLFVLTLYN